MKATVLLPTIIYSLLLIGFTACAQAPNSPVKIGVKLITDQLSNPTAFAEPADKSGRLFVAEQAGRIRILKNGILLKTPFLDIADEVLKNDGYEERGLLGFAFHPNYAKNGKFYVYRSVKTSKAKGVNHKSEVREYTASKQNPNLADKASSKLVLEFNQPESNHNGGDIKFGPDGYLYVTTGDGGGQNDKHGEFGNAQNLGNLLGKILRIDVNQLPYKVPADNPFLSKENAAPEIFAYGFRNPWRISFDRLNGKLFAGDVGQDSWEEVDIVTKGGNYGWRVREGMHEKHPNDPDPKNWINPITEYPHPEGISVTGGFVYRGKQIPSLVGKYVFADWMGPVFSLTDVKKGLWKRETLSISRNAGYWQITSFGEDRAGELYILAVVIETGKGSVYKIVPGK